MGGCCDPRECDWRFDARVAERRARAYRTRGLDATAQRMVDLLTEHGVRGASVLEIGGGVGEIQLELLRRGAVSATNLELSPHYEAAAARLFAEAGLSDRVDRRVVDIAAEPGAVEPADIVVLHRVVCCYPDYATLLGAAATHTRRHLMFSHPPRSLVARALVGAENLPLRLGRRRFRVFVHPPDAMRAVVAEHGLQPTVVHGGLAWQITAGSR